MKRLMSPLSRRNFYQKTVSFFVLASVLSGCFGGGGNALDPLVTNEEENTKVGNQVLIFGVASADFGDVPLSPAYYDKTFTVTNSHTKDVFIERFESDNSVFTIQGTTCPLSPLPIGSTEQCEITVRFSPQSYGDQSATLTGYYVAKVGKEEFHSEVGLLGKSIEQPIGNSGLTFDPDIYDFGDVPVAPAFGEKMFKLANTTNASVWIGSIALNNALFSVQSNSCIVGNAATELASGAQCSIVVRFSPIADGEQQALLSVAYGGDASRAGQLVSRAALSGRSNTGPIGNSAISFNPAYWDYGDVAAGNNSTKTFTIKNVKTTSIYISGITSSNAVFSITSNTCPGSSTALAAGATCEIVVRFAPTTDGGQSSDITVAYGPDVPRNNTLSAILVTTGRSTATPIGNSAVTFTPNYWDYGDVAASITSNKQFTVKNASSSAIHIGTIVQTNSTNFALSHDCPMSPSTLAANATCTITLGFTPNTDGGYSSDVTVSYGPDAARSTSLQSKIVTAGRSTANPYGATALAFTPNYWDFDDVAHNVTVNKQLTLTNTSSSAVVISTITRTNTSVFGLSHNCPTSPSTFAAGATCTVTMSYTPTTDGSWNSDIVASYGPDAARSSNVQATAIVTGRSTDTPYGATNITFSPDYHDFGDIASGQTSTLTGVTVTNAGTQPVHISSITSNNSKIAVQSSNCPISPSTLASAGTCTFSLKFSPTADGVQTAKITAAFGPDAPRSGNLQSVMTAVGRSTSTPSGQIALTFNPSYHDFGDIAVGQMGTQTIVVTNGSTDPVYLTAVGNFSSTNANFFSSGTTCPSGATPLNAGATCNVTFRYSPTASGVESATVTVLHGPDQPRSSNLSATFTLAGRSTSANTGNSAITFNPVYWDFGDVAASTTVNKVITLTNSSTSPIYIGNVSRSNGTIFLLSDDCPRSPTALAASASCNLTYSFAPTSDGGQTSTATILYGPDHPRSSDFNAKFVVSGRSTAVSRGNPSISFTPDYKDYGDVAAGQSVDYEYTVTNVTTSPVYLSAPTSDNAVFLIVPSTATCPSGSTALAASGTCKIKVRFSPTADGIQTANIVTSYGPDPQRASNQNAKFIVNGRSTAAPTGNEAFTFTPSYWDFNDVAAGVSVQKVINVKNFTASPVYISSITRTNTSVYAISHNCPATPTALAAGADCDVTVTFTPTADGVQASTLTVAYGPDDPRSSNYSSTVSLTGRSTAAANGNSSFTFSPSYWDFGDVAASTTATKQITLTNATSSPLYLKATGSISSSNAKFTITGSNCPSGSTPLAASLSCNFTVNFTPTADGAQDAEIIILHGPDEARSGNLSAKMVVTGRSSATPIGNTAVTYNPDYWDFGDVAAGQTVTKAITITNASSSNIYISDVTRTNTGVFTISDNCPRSPSALASTLTCTATVGFTPTADGGQSSNVAVVYGPDAARSTNLETKMAVAGRSYAQPVGADGIEFNPTYYDFGNITAGANQSTTIQVQNTSTHPLYISSIAESSAEYSITANTCPTSPTALAASATCNVTVKYTPADTGSDTIELQATYGPDTARATNLKATMMLIGRSEPIPIGNSAIDINPNTWDFGNVPLSPSYSDKVIVLTNNSTQSIYLGSFTGLASPYSVATHDCPMSPTAMGAGNTCNVTVRFSPVTGAQASATLSVNYGQDSGTPTQYTSQASFTGRSNPVAPSNFVVQSNTATSITFSWDDNSFDESSFEIQRCDGAGCESSFTSAAGVTVAADSTSYTWSSLTEGNFYQFRIRSKVSSTASTWLTGPMAITFGGVAPTPTTDNGTGDLNSLADVDCDSASPGAYVNLKWTDASVAAYYQIYDKSSGTPQFISTVNAPADHFLISGLTPGISKDYTVQAVTESGVISKATASVAITTTTYSPCLVIGQKNEITRSILNGATSEIKAPLLSSYEWALNQPRGLWTDGTKLVVSDQSNHRVLIWNSQPASPATPPDVVLGQPNRSSITANNGGTSARTLSQPIGVASNGTKLVVADYANHRVLIWNTWPTTDFQAADVVVGQATMSSKSANGGGANCQAAAVQGKGLNNPYGVVIVGTKLIVSEYSNHRVLIWNTIPTSNFAQADVALGNQTTWATACSGTTTQSTLKNPAGIWSDGTRLFVADRGNNRVMIWNSIASLSAFNTSADARLGQASWTTANANNAGVSWPGKLNQPYGLTGTTTELYVADYANHRVLLFPSSAWVNAGQATQVIGQTSLSTASAANTQNGLNGPIDVAVDASGSLAWVAGYGNHRLTKYSLPLAAPPTANSAAGLFGQNLYTSNYKGHMAAQQTRVARPWGVWSAGGKLVVSDASNNRVLLYSSMPTAAFPSATTVLGQTNFTNADPDQGGSASASTLDSPRGVWTDGTRVLVADRSNNRVLLWKGGSFPSSNGASASGVLGQASMTATGAGNSATTLRNPDSVFVTDISGWTGNPGDYGIFVADTDNYRVAVYVTNSTMSTIGTSGATAQHVFGQSSFTARTAGCTNVRPNRIRSVWSDGTHLVAADTDNHRVLIWNDIRTINMGVDFDVPADVILGQPDDVTCTANSGVGSPQEDNMNYPTSVWSDGTRLFVVDQRDHRVLIWNTWPTTTAQPADRVIGQAGFSSGAINAGGGAYPTSHTFSYPLGIWGDVVNGVASRLFITDGANITNFATETNKRVITIPNQ